MVKDSISADLKGLGPLGMEFKINSWDCNMSEIEGMEFEYLRLKDLLPGISSAFVL